MVVNGWCSIETEISVRARVLVGVPEVIFLVVVVVLVMVGYCGVRCLLVRFYGLHGLRLRSETSSRSILHFCTKGA